jgi:hypothetical protein
MPERKGRPPRADQLKELKPIIKIVIDYMSIPKLISEKEANCPQGRSSIRNWLDGRKGEKDVRALPDNVALALCRYVHKTSPQRFAKVQSVVKRWLEDCLACGVNLETGRLDAPWLSPAEIELLTEMERFYESLIYPSGNPPNAGG